MNHVIRKILNLNGPKPEGTNDFSEFFTSSTSGKTRAKVIRQVLREANKEQKSIVEKK